MMNVQITSMQTHLHVLAGGGFEIAEAKRTLLEVIDAVISTAIYSVLFDGRGISGQPTVIERFYYANLPPTRLMGGSRNSEYLSALSSHIFSFHRCSTLGGWAKRNGGREPGIECKGF